jgi:ABC-2 type transport system permease protein
VLLLVSGANVPVDRLPGWLQTIGSGLPLTHGIEAARGVVAGQALAENARLLLLELAVGLAYAGLGLLLLRAFEFESRRTASLETTQPATSPRRTSRSGTRLRWGPRRERPDRSRVRARGR